MPFKILIVQPDEDAARALARILTSRGDQVWHAADAVSALAQIKQLNPGIVMVDLHMPGNEWLSLLRHLHTETPGTHVVITNKTPDVQREMLAKEQGVQVFLRQPFTQKWVEQAFVKLGLAEITPVKKKAVDPGMPRVRFPVRLKITLPYMVLALVFALAGAYVVTQFVIGSIQERFNAQLVGAGWQSADWMVQEEDRRLETLRVIANTQGVAAAVQQGDAEALRQLVLPYAVNAKEEAIEILDSTGTSVLSLRHPAGSSVEEYVSSRGDTVFAGWDFVRYVLDRRTENGQDKNSGLAQTTWGDYFYVSGPILTADGSLAGVVLVGRSIIELARQMRQDTLAEITIYNRDGQPLGSSLSTNPADVLAVPPADTQALFSSQDNASMSRDMAVASTPLREVLGPWEARGGTDLGILGTAMPRVYLSTTNQLTRIQVFALVAVALLLVLAVGIILANQITRPLLKVVKASSEVARGNLEVKVDPSGNDEVAVLAHTFNAMVSGLQEGSMYRDLLGRTVSPEVRDQLRQTFLSGNVRLEGQEAVATVMMSSIRGFSSLSEKTDPATLFRWLNEYFSDLVPIVIANNGVVNKIDGEDMLAFYGILPEMLSPQRSAYAACQAAMEIIATVERLNLQRVERGEPPLSPGIGITTGMVAAGGLGTSDRLHYTIIGETVNASQRLQTLALQLFNIPGVIISQSTYQALGEYRDHFRLDALGPYVAKGRAEQIQIYRLTGTAGLVEPVNNSIELVA